MYAYLLIKIYRKIYILFNASVSFNFNFNKRFVFGVCKEEVIFILAHSFSIFFKKKKLKISGCRYAYSFHFKVRVRYYIKLITNLV